MAFGVVDELRPDQSATVAGDEPDRDVRIADLGVLGGNDDVAEQCQRGAEAGGVAVEAAD